MKNSHRKNMQTKQPGIQYEPEGNGWPEPLADASDPIRYSSIVGKKGETISKPVTDVQSTK